MAWPRWMRRKVAETPPRTSESEPSAAAPQRAAGQTSALDRALTAMDVPFTAEHRQMALAPAHARAAFSDHPAVGLGARTDATAAGGSARVASFGFTPSISLDVARMDGPETAEALPVLLLETRNMLAFDLPGHGVVEAQVQAVGAHGFSLWSDAPMALRQIPDWTLSLPSPERLELHGPGGRWAYTTLSPDPQWLAAAASQQVVLVLFGPQLGVRADDPSNDYPSESSRKAELDKARTVGFVGVGVVAYMGCR